MEAQVEDTQAEWKGQARLTRYRNAKDLHRSQMCGKKDWQSNENTLSRERHKGLHRPPKKERLDLRIKVTGRSLEGNRDAKTRLLAGKREGKTQTSSLVKQNPRRES